MSGRLRFTVVLGGIVAAAAMAAADGGRAADAPPYVLEVSDAVAPIGAPTTVRATLRLRDGLRFLESYNNRVIKLSALNGGVSFDREVVRGTIRDGSLIFAVGVTPTAPGKHPINGVIRLGYAEGRESMKMVSVPLIATVTGTE